MIQKLISKFRPDNYQLTLDVNTETMLFSGTVTIVGELLSASKNIILHGKGLVIQTASVNSKTCQAVTPKADDILELSTAEVHAAGKVGISVTFSGEITDQMQGIYPCYFEHEGQKKKLIATQFESHHAREVFPCVDEPAAKATFDLTLITPEEVAVLANTLVDSHSTENGRLTSTFKTTPKMSTYLLAFVFGEMHAKEARTKDGVLVRSWASVAQDVSWLDYAVKEAVDFIEFYNEYFKVPYPLEKCDQVALPDFESGAMENWGLITYRESILLSDPKNISLSGQQLTSLVIAHEVSHQWFGNLVTMAWWDDLWLNESFANMMEYLAVDILHSEWQIWEEFVAHDCIAATNRDVYSNVQSVRVTVNNPVEIHTLFDPSIVYAKGGKLLKTLHDLIGSEAWRAGLRDYFKKHAHANTTRDDLWAALSQHSDYDIATLMNTWLEHSGLPLVSVDQDGKKVQLSQKRLLLDEHEDSTTWQVPLLARGAPDLLEQRASTLSLESTDWLKLNSTGFGHYIVNYLNPTHKQWLAQQIADNTQSSNWKIIRLNELIMLARHGDTNLSEALDAIQGTESEPRAKVWSQIAGVLGSARMLVEEDEQAEKLLRSFTYQLVKHHYATLGWKYSAEEPSNTTHLRTTILSFAVASEAPAVIEQALKLYRQYKSPEHLPAELRAILMSCAVKFGDPEDFATLLNEYKTSMNADYREDICAALTATRNTKKAKVLLDIMLDTKLVRPQDTRQWYVYLLRNRYTRELTWQWLTKNWSWILKNFGNGKSYDDFVRYSASFMNTQKSLDAYKEFFEDKKQDPALQRSIAIGIEEIKARVLWRNRDQSIVSEWLEKL